MSRGNRAGGMEEGGRERVCESGEEEEEGCEGDGEGRYKVI